MPEPMKNELEAAVEEAINKPSSTPALRAVEQSLTQQWSKLERIESELRDRIRRERLKLVSDYESRVLAIQNDFASKISEEVSRLEKLRDHELHALANQLHDKIHEHELLAKRMTNYPGR